MDNKLACPICTMTDILEAAEVHECATCGHEWAKELQLEEDVAVVKDANGNPLHDGDSVTVIKDLKVKGSSVTLKAGTKIKGIRVVDGDHDVDCKVDGMGVMLKAKFLKKA
ncbi:MAG: alkylphosphonate utilization protein [Deltaproteobacteria bacterium]|nr:alkylphosphonate utilization protein [Deltaproteobacteria bacterium]MBW2396491.1 alkylphosphonate utilization protein [Deltaproteobacteria bacterium]